MRMLELFAGEHDIGGFHGDIGTGANGDADFRAGQGWGVVDAIADHRHDPALGLQPADLGELVAGQHVGHDPVDAHLGGHRAGRSLVVHAAPGTGQTQTAVALAAMLESGDVIFAAEGEGEAAATARALPGRPTSSRSSCVDATRRAPVPVVGASARRRAAVTQSRVRRRCVTRCGRAASSPRRSILLAS